MLKIKDIFNIKKVKRLEAEIVILKTEIKIKESEIATLRKPLNISNLLLEENKVLIKWIHGILEQFGTMDVYDRKRINIPVYRKLEPNYFTSNCEVQRTEVETIIIPEIVISKIK